jgi:uncharacterized protein YkvS
MSLSQMSPLTKVAVADVALDEAVAWIVLDVPQVLEIARVGELVEVDDLAVGVVRKVQADEVAADEACAARDQDSHVASR